VALSIFFLVLCATAGSITTIDVFVIFFGCLFLVYVWHAIDGWAHFVHFVHFAHFFFFFFLLSLVHFCMYTDCASCSGIEIHVFNQIIVGYLPLCLYTNGMYLFLIICLLWVCGVYDLLCKCNQCMMSANCLHCSFIDEKQLFLLVSSMLKTMFSRFWS
jgi:hypothetical protein